MEVSDIPEVRTAGHPFTVILQSLERSLTIDLIASGPLINCAPRDLADEVFQRSESISIDQVPVKDGARIVGVLERDESSKSGLRAFESMQPLAESMLVGASTGILTYIHLAAGSPYHLVVNENAIDGIVTRSDLLKLPVRLVLFAFLTHLEETMANVIRIICPDDCWRKHLAPGREVKVRNEYERGKAKNVYADLLSFTQWCDKRDVLAQVLPSGIRGSKNSFTKDHKSLEELRNGVMHANEYLTDAGALSDLVRRCDHWITRLQGVLEGDNDG